MFRVSALLAARARRVSHRPAQFKNAPRREALVVEDLLRRGCRQLIADGRARRTTLAQAYAGLLRGRAGPFRP